jgi:hypothetical protein
MNEPDFIQQPTATKNKSDPGFVFGIVSLVSSIFGFGLFGIIFGIVAIVQSKKVGKTNVLGIIGIIWGILSGIFFFVLISVFLAVPTLQQNQRNMAATNTLFMLESELSTYYTTYGYFPVSIDDSGNSTFFTATVDSSGNNLFNDAPQANQEAAIDAVYNNLPQRTFVYVPYDCTDYKCKDYIASILASGSDTPRIVSSSTLPVTQ